MIWRTWLIRICFSIVFLLNVTCALGFIFAPWDFSSAYQLEGISGAVAIQGIGVAFLMWNATYPMFILAPKKFKVLGWIIVAQQIIGLVGETFIYFSLGNMSNFALLVPFASFATAAAGAQGYEILSASILRFIIFDATGLVLMLVSLMLFLNYSSRKL